MPGDLDVGAFLAARVGQPAREVVAELLRALTDRRVTSLAYARWPWPFPPPMEFAWYPDPSSFRLEARQ